MKKTNVILICIDGGRVDRAKKSKIFQNLKSKGVFLPKTITYAPYTNRMETEMGVLVIGIQ